MESIKRARNKNEVPTARTIARAYRPARVATSRRPGLQYLNNRKMKNRPPSPTDDH